MPETGISKQKGLGRLSLGRQQIPTVKGGGADPLGAGIGSNQTESRTCV